jgi:hypothetical protein
VAVGLVALQVSHSVVPTAVHWVAQKETKMVVQKAAPKADL